MLSAWRADALIMISLAEKEFCVDTKSGRFLVGTSELSDMLVGASELLEAKLTAHAAIFTLSYLKSKPATLLKKALPLSLRNKLQVFIAGAIPFFGFGVTDNGLMVIFGDLIDHHLSKFFKLTPMGLAAWANLLSDIVGVFMGGSIQQLANRMGAAEPVMSYVQRNLPSTIQYRLLGEATGITLGCWAGMAPLLICPERYNRAEANAEIAGGAPPLR